MEIRFIIRKIYGKKSILQKKYRFDKKSFVANLQPYANIVIR